MVRSASAWSTRDKLLMVAAAALQLLAAKHELGLPCALLLGIAAPFVFGRDAWDGETSAYSVFNSGCRRIAGTFTAEQFDAQLRGGPRPADEVVTSQPTFTPVQPPAPAPVDPALRRRRAAEAAERRAAEGAGG